MTHMEKAEGTHYRDELLAKIIEICNQGDYQHITNFEWFVDWRLFRFLRSSLYLNRYISILVELTRLEGTKHGSLISLQLLDVAVRVESIRTFACHQMVEHCNRNIPSIDLSFRLYFLNMLMFLSLVRIQPMSPKCYMLLLGFVESLVREYLQSIGFSSRKYSI